MNKKTALLAGVLVIFGAIATLGVIASTDGGMIKKGITQMPEGRSEYTAPQMTDEELRQLEQELKAEEAMPTEQQPVLEEEEEVIMESPATPAQTQGMEETTMPVEEEMPTPVQ